MLGYYMNTHIARWRDPSPKRHLNAGWLDSEIRPEGCLTILLVKECQRVLQVLLGRRTLAVLQPTIWTLVSSMVAAFCETGLRITVCLDNMLIVAQNRELLAVQADLVKTILESPEFMKNDQKSNLALVQQNPRDLRWWGLCSRNFQTVSRINHTNASDSKRAVRTAVIPLRESLWITESLKIELGKIS